jgi:hypothetical protein
VHTVRQGTSSGSVKNIPRTWWQRQRTENLKRDDMMSDG